MGPKMCYRFGIRWAMVLAVGVATIGLGCSDDMWEQDFFEPRTMHPYEFDGQPQIEGPEALYYLGLQVGEREVRSATIKNVGRTTLEIEGVQIDAPFELHEVTIDEMSGKQLLPGESLALQVAYRAADEEERLGLLSIFSDDPQRPRLDIDLVADAEVPCPSAVIAADTDVRQAVADPHGEVLGRPLGTAMLDATDSHAIEGRSIVAYEWRLVELPQDTFVTLDEPAGSPTNGLYLELSGTYVVELEVWDSEGTQSCEPARMTIEVVSGDAIHLQLVWDTPTDPDPHNNSGTDLDLHFLHQLGQWNRVPYDCHWMNPNPTWGDPEDPDMDPRLDIDEVHGWGPENINLLLPEEGVRYGVGVNYFSDHGYGPSYATVRIFIHGLLEREFAGRYMEDGEFWHVADIDWPSADLTVRDTITEGFPAQ